MNGYGDESVDSRHAEAIYTLPLEQKMEIECPLSSAYSVYRLLAIATLTPFTGFDFDPTSAKMYGAHRRVGRFQARRCDLDTSDGIEDGHIMSAESCVLNVPIARNSDLRTIHGF